MQIIVNKDALKEIQIAASKSAKQPPKNLFESVDISQFQMNDTLNPDIFDSNEVMLPKIRKTLLKIGRDCYDFLGIDWVDLKDIILTGSQANYNWSKFSDIDLHLLISYKEISNNSSLVEEFVYAKKELWNKEHDIKISNYNVELYVENIDDDNLIAGGIYSVLYDKWLKHPQKIRLNVNQDRVNKIFDYFNGKFLALQKRAEAGDCYGLYDDVNALKNDLRTLRKDGLSNGGEFSEENLAFKALRRSGINDGLDELKTDLYDNAVSIEQPTIGKDRSEEPQKEKPKPADKKKEDKPDPNAKGLGRFKIHGKPYTSLRQAEKILGIPKSTIEFRLKSDNPSFSDYIELDV